MSTRDVLVRCEEVLHTFDLPRPFTVTAFCDALSRVRGRPVRLVPMAFGAAAPCGLWVSTDQADYVFYQVVTSPLHQEHIALHELAHMIFNHAATDHPDDIRALLLPRLDPDMVAEVLARTSYTSEQEQEAETLADLVGTRARRRPVPDGTDATFARLLDMLGPPM